MSKFRIPGNNKLITTSLFKEVANTKNTVLYSISAVDNEYPSIQRLYVQAMDLSEYKFATEYFESYNHWVMIRDSKWFETTYSQMRLELEAKIQSMAHDAMMDQVLEGKAGHQTLSYLANKGYIEKPKVGRPSKKTVENQAQKLTKAEQEFQKELERITEHNPKIRKIK